MHLIFYCKFPIAMHLEMVDKVCTVDRRSKVCNISNLFAYLSIGSTISWQIAKLIDVIIVVAFQVESIVFIIQGK